MTRLLMMISFALVALAGSAHADNLLEGAPNPVVMAAEQGPSPITVAVTAGVALKLAFEHDGLNTTGYRYYVDGVKVGADIPLSALVSGTATFDAPALARGPHVLGVTAFNQDSESAPFALAVIAKLPAPNAPKNLKQVITITIARDGTMHVLISEVQ